ncbi:MAG: ubiquinol-cytochrome C chaperone family protein, partial [Pseudomonadota bacterium]
DRFETRFDVLALHLFLMLEALEKSGPGDAANLQRLVLEAAMRDLEDTMRRRGISDVRVGKTVQKHSTIFFGRLASCRKVREGSEPLAALLVRTVYRGQQDHSAKAFACYLDDLAGRFLDLQTGWWQDPAFRWPKAASQSG